MESARKENQDAFGPPEIQPEEIQLHSVLGQGAFGTVWRGTCRAIDVAVKVPNNARRITQRQLEAFQGEVLVMSKIYHPNVALFMGACTTAPEKIRIVTELLEGDVEHLLQDKSKDLSLYFRMKMSKDAAQGMAWLHGGNPVILHRDFKTSNLLYDRNKTVKVCDFGLSQLFEKGTKLQDEKRPKGTPLYMAPEVWLGREFDQKADIYSFGVVLWEILTREPAFAHHNSVEEFKRAITALDERPPIPPDCLPSLRDLMTRCWDKDPAKRPYFPEIVERLGEIIVEAAVRDKLGYQFWMHYASKKEYFLAKDFFPLFYEVMQLPLPRDVDHNIPTCDVDVLNLRCLRALLVTMNDSNEEIVHIQRFGDILGWFGPLEVPVKSGDSIMDRMRAVLSSTKGPNPEHADTWFHGFISVTAADNMLRTQEPGTFLVRFSSNSHYPTWYTISKVSSDGKVRSIRVEHEPGTDWIIRDERNKEHRYKSLIDVVEKAVFLHLKKACPGSPYQVLFAQGVHDIAGYKLADDEMESERVG
jgi:serine/threonine protein kinase